MALTPSQLTTVKSHGNITWLSDRASRNELIHQDTIRSKIAEAIGARLDQSRVTEGNIRDVAANIRIDYGDRYVPAEEVVGLVAEEAVRELEGENRLLAQTLRMIFKKTANGRTAPGTSGINHIHIGGIGTQNILFDSFNAVALGLVDGHMDSKMAPKIRNEADRVNQRKGGLKVRMRIVGNTISRA